MTTNISNGQESIPKDSYTCLLYGDFGSAKTPFCGTFGDRTLYFNCGAGISTLYSPKYESMYGKWNAIKVDVIEKDQFNPTAYDEICTIIDDYNEKYADRFDTIIIDDAAGFQYFATNKALLVAAQMVSSPGQAKSEKLGANIPDLADYKFEKALVDQFMRNYADDCKMRGKNFVVVAHAKRDYGKPQRQGEEAPLLNVHPHFTGQNKIASYFDYVWYASVENGKAIVQTEGDAIYEARSRYAGIFPARYFNPNYPEIKNALNIYYSTGKIPPKEFWKR